MKYAYLAGLAALGGCTTIAPEPFDDQTISHYVRSNSDGSMPENIVHFFPEENEIAVYKWVVKCETAAYVTATTGGSPLEARRFVAGKVAQDGSQAAFGVLSLDDATRTLRVEVSMGGQEIVEETEAGPAPSMLYDYDLADLHAMLRARPSGGDFSVSMTMIWPEQPPFFRSLGRVEFKDVGVVEGLRVYQTNGPELRGKVMADPRNGQLVMATFDRPNHPGYDDYMLRLERTQRGGRSAWDDLTRAHYADCPAD